MPISHIQFGELRLSQFAPASEIVALSKWRFMERTWVGEAVGFSEWLRPENSPDLLQSLALDLAALPESTSSAVLARLGLPLHRGMTVGQIAAVLGEPVAMQSFVADRTSYEFRWASAEAYNVSCTVHARGGLAYVIVSVPFAVKKRGA